MYFYVSVLYLYTVSVNQALCSMLVAATGPLLLILLNNSASLCVKQRFKFNRFFVQLCSS